MKNLILITALIFLSGCAHQDEWTSRDTVLQIAVSVVMAADAYTTSKIQYNDEVYEAGFVARKLIGSQPSTLDSWTYIGTLMVSSYFINRALPAKWRPYFQTFQIFDHGIAVVGNCQLDLGC